MTPIQPSVDFLDALLTAHGLRRTQLARKVLGWFVTHPDTSFTHAQLLAALAAMDTGPLDRVTLYRQIDRLSGAGLLLCRVDAQRVRRYQSMPASVRAIPHFECQSCHRDSVLPATLQADNENLERAAQSTLEAFSALGFVGKSMDFAVRGVCADCVSASAVGAEP
jgi:Fur family transcriptional regulator, ferric uptake regulator